MAVSPYSHKGERPFSTFREHARQLNASFSRLRIGDYLQYYTDPDKDDTCAVFVGQAANASPSNVTAPVVMIDRTIIKTMPKALVLRYDGVNASFQRIDMGRVYMDTSGRFTLSMISRPAGCLFGFEMPFNLSNWDELIPLTRDRFQGGLVRVTPYNSRSLGNNMTGSRITIESPAHIHTAFTEYGAPLTTQTPWRDFASTALANENAG